MKARANRQDSPAGIPRMTVIPGAHVHCGAANNGHSAAIFARDAVKLYGHVACVACPQAAVYCKQHAVQTATEQQFQLSPAAV